MPFGVVFPQGAGRIPQFSPKTAPDPNLSGTQTAEQTQERNIAKGKTRSYLIIGGAVALIAALSCFVLAERNEPFPSRFSKEEAVQELQKLGVIASELDIQGEVGRKAMFAAVDQGNTAILELLLAGGINVDQRGVGRERTFSFAVLVGHPEIVKLLLAVPGIDVNEDDPLGRAASIGHTEVVKLLLAAPGIDVNESRALFDAAERGHTEMVKLLLAAPGIDVNERTPLARAACNGHTEVVKLLLAAPGIDVNKEHYFGRPLTKAAQKGHTEIVKLLLAAPGIDVNVNNDDETPLWQAAGRGHTEIVKLLLAAPGIDVNRANKSGSTPLSNAAYYGHTEIVKLLRAAGAHG